MAKLNWISFRVDDKQKREIRRHAERMGRGHGDGDRWSVSRYILRLHDRHKQQNKYARGVGA